MSRVSFTAIPTKDGEPDKQMPFAMLVMSDGLAGNAPTAKPKKDSEIEPVSITKDNFDKVMEGMGVGVQINDVPDKLSPDGDEKSLSVRLSFNSMKDFSPANVANQIPALKALLDKQRMLKELLNRCGDDEAAKLLSQIVQDHKSTESGS